MGNGTLSPRIKWQGPEFGHSLHLVPSLRISSIIRLLALYVIMAWTGTTKIFLLFLRFLTEKRIVYIGPIFKIRRLYFIKWL